MNSKLLKKILFFAMFFCFATSAFFVFQISKKDSSSQLKVSVDSLAKPYDKLLQGRVEQITSLTESEIARKLNETDYARYTPDQLIVKVGDEQIFTNDLNARIYFQDKISYAYLDDIPTEVLNRAIIELINESLLLQAAANHDLLQLSSDFYNNPNKDYRARQKALKTAVEALLDLDDTLNVSGQMILMHNYISDITLVSKSEVEDPEKKGLFLEFKQLHQQIFAKEISMADAQNSQLISASPDLFISGNFSITDSQTDKISDFYDHRINRAIKTMQRGEISDFLIGYDDQASQFYLIAEANEVSGNSLLQQTIQNFYQQNEQLIINGKKVLVSSDIINQAVNNAKTIARQQIITQIHGSVYKGIQYNFIHGGDSEGRCSLYTNQAAQTICIDYDHSGVGGDWDAAAKHWCEGSTYQWCNCSCNGGNNCDGTCAPSHSPSPGLSMPVDGSCVPNSGNCPVVQYTNAVNTICVDRDFCGSDGNGGNQQLDIEYDGDVSPECAMTAMTADACDGSSCIGGLTEPFDAMVRVPGGNWERNLTFAGGDPVPCGSIVETGIYIEGIVYLTYPDVTFTYKASGGSEYAPPYDNNGWIPSAPGSWYALVDDGCQQQDALVECYEPTITPTPVGPTNTPTVTPTASLIPTATNTPTPTPSPTPINNPPQASGSIVSNQVCQPSGSTGWSGVSQNNPLHIRAIYEETDINQLDMLSVWVGNGNNPDNDLLAGAYGRVQRQGNNNYRLVYKTSSGDQSVGLTLNDGFAICTIYSENRQQFCDLDNPLPNNTSSYLEPISISESGNSVTVDWNVKMLSSVIFREDQNLNYFVKARDNLGSETSWLDQADWRVDLVNPQLNGSSSFTNGNFFDINFNYQDQGSSGIHIAKSCAAIGLNDPEFITLEDQNRTQSFTFTQVNPLKPSPCFTNNLNETYYLEQNTSLNGNLEFTLSVDDSACNNTTEVFALNIPKPWLMTQAGDIYTNQHQLILPSNLISGTNGLFDGITPRLTTYFDLQASQFGGSPINASKHNFNAVNYQDLNTYPLRSSSVTWYDYLVDQINSKVATDHIFDRTLQSIVASNTSTQALTNNITNEVTVVTFDSVTFNRNINCNTKTIFLVNNLTIQPNFNVSANNRGCIFIAKNTTIGLGSDLNSDDTVTYYDAVNAFIITNQFNTLANTATNRDGLLITGGVIANTSDTAATSIFSRDLQLARNQYAPSEVISYDGARYIHLFAEIFRYDNTSSIREIKFIEGLNK